MSRKRARVAAPNTRRRVATPAGAVMKAFRAANLSAPGFMSSCGVFPEVSESASDHLHPIVHDLAVRHLKQGRYLASLQRTIRRVAATSRPGDRQALIDRMEADLTAVLAAQATAAYVFGLSVGLTVRSLPERLDP